MRMNHKTRAITAEEKAREETYEKIRSETRSKNIGILSTDRYKNTLWQFERLLIRNIHYVNRLLKKPKLDAREKKRFRTLLNWICESFRCIGVENAKIWYANSNYKIHGDTRFLMYRYFFNPFFDFETRFGLSYDWHNTIFELVPDRDMTSFIRIPILVGGLYNHSLDVYCDDCGYKLPAYDLEEVLGLTKAQLYPFCYFHAPDCKYSPTREEIFGKGSGALVYENDGLEE